MPGYARSRALAGTGRDPAREGPPATGGREVLGWAAGIPRVAWVLFAALPLLQLTVAATGPVIPQVREAFELSYVAVGAFIASLSAGVLNFCHESLNLNASAHSTSSRLGTSGIH